MNKIKTIILFLKKHIDAERRRAVFLASLILFFLVSSLVWKALASAPTNIKSESKYAYSENAGWMNFGSSYGGVMVSDLSLNGYAWSESLGWISLNCSNNDSCSVVDYKVANDNEGNLSGYAWSENAGWINFAPSNGGVHINSAGEFSGYAWCENFGWIAFNCQDLDSCLQSDFKVATTWLPLSVRSKNDNPGDIEGMEISDVHYSSTDTMIVINWRTNHKGNSHIDWGKNRSLDEEKNSNSKEEKHRIVLRGLEPNTKYYFQINSADENDNRDSSKIYSLNTKSEPIILKKHKYGSFIKNGKNLDSLEELQIQVSDKKEDVGSVTKKESGLDDFLKSFGSDGVSNESTEESSFLANIKGYISNFSSAVGEFLIDNQRGIEVFVASVKDNFKDSYARLAYRFDRQKADELLKARESKFFTTQVFSKNEKKILAEVRFRVLDKSENPIPNLDTTLFSDPQSSVTDENGVTTFKDVPIGQHTLVFDYAGENFKKKVMISDTLTDDGMVRAEIVQVKAEKEILSVWMWGVIVLAFLTMIGMIFFATKYYKLKNGKT